MELHEYQKRAWNTALPSAKCLAYLIPGLAAEAGEVAGKYAKYIRDGGSDEKLAEELNKELGDVLWFVACTLTVIGYSADNCAMINLDKLESRQQRGVLGGSGDNR